MTARHAPTVGTVVDVPGFGPVTVETVTRRYFTGTRDDGEQLAATGLGLIRGERLG